MRTLIIVFALVLSVASCKNTPKQIVKDAAITHLKTSGVRNINILSVDSIERWSTSDFKKICKKELETLQTLTTSAMSTLNNTYYTPEQQANVNRLTVVFTDSMQKYIPQLSVSYNNIDKHTDVTKYIYKVMYSCASSSKDSLFVYCTTDYKGLTFSPKRDNSNITDKQFTNDVATFISTCMYFKFMVANYQKVIENPQYWGN